VYGPKENFLIHTTTLKSTPEAAIFISSQSWGTKSKAFEKSTRVGTLIMATLL
jgi:hypothetical protein